MVMQPGPAGPMTDPLKILTPFLVTASAVFLFTWFLLSRLWPRTGAGSSKSEFAAAPTTSDADDSPSGGELRRRGRDGHNLMGTFIPSTGLLEANPLRPYPFENEFCHGCLLPKHRPTTDRALDKSCDYIGGAHFRGRKRLWEIRLQFRVKQDVTRPMRFGVELEKYVPLNAATKQLLSMTVAALRQVVGNDLYHSPGDDPSKTSEPLEKPVFAMPMWAFDQFIVTPAGEEPPDLTDPHFGDFGHKRTDDRAAFIKEMSKLELKAGPTYTFSFWGISQFIDNIRWELQRVIPFRSIDCNMFCGGPPMNIVLYTLSPEDGEPRHLQRRKDYYFRLACWSSKKPPSQQQLRELLPKNESREEPGADAKGSQRGAQSKCWSSFACCAQHREPRSD